MGVGDDVGGATAEAGLVEYRRAVRAQVDAGGQGSGDRGAHGVVVVALVGYIRQPAVAGDLALHGAPPGVWRVRRVLPRCFFVGGNPTEYFSSWNL